MQKFLKLFKIILQLNKTSLVFLLFSEPNNCVFQSNFSRVNSVFIYNESMASFFIEIENSIFEKV